MLHHTSTPPALHAHPRNSRRAAAAMAAVVAIGLSTAHAYETENVVVVIIDGVRYSEGFGDTSHAYVPRMAALAPEGAVIEPFLNDGFTYTSRAIPAIWCGAWTDVSQFTDPDCGGTQNNYSRSPTVFEYFRKQLGQPEEDCIYVLKDVGCPWKASFDPDYGPEFWPMYHSEGYTDLAVWGEAQTILATYAPRFLMLYLAEVDQAGHSGDWAYYTRAIATADRIVGELWDYLQAAPAYAGRTTMFVTNDHGRHTYDWTGHGCECAGCRTIQLLALGPDIIPGLVSIMPRTLCDITPTVGELLGFDAEDATGVPLLEILEPAVRADDGLPIAASGLRIAPLGVPFGLRRDFMLSLPCPGVTALTVRTPAGHLVATPFRGWLSAGEHVVQWYPAGPNGGATAAGVYILTVESGPRIASTLTVHLP